MKKATIYDISQILKVNPSTVSRALKNDPVISKETILKVQKVAKELNYYPNKTASRLKSGKSNTVGVIVPYIHHGLFSAAIQAIEEALFPLGYSVIICQTHESYENETTHILNLLNNQVECIFISVSKNTSSHDHFQRVLDRGVPLVFFDRTIDMKGISAITIDDFKGAYTATEHLIEQGCKRIAHFQGNQNLEIYRNRYNGYLKALQDYNIPINQDLVIPCGSAIEEGKKALKKLWKLTDKADAIFSSSDHASLGAMQQLQYLGVNIPQEVAIVGFSNEIFTEYIETPLSSVFQFPNVMGKEAAQVFINQIESNNPIKITETKVIAPELIKRKSSIKA